MVALSVIYPPEAPPPYITVDYFDLEFSEREYHLRVRDQIVEDGYQDVCVTHLNSLTWNAKITDVNRARQNLVYVTECDKATR